MKPQGIKEEFGIWGTKHSTNVIWLVKGKNGFEPYGPHDEIETKIHFKMEKTKLKSNTLVKLISD